MKRLSLFICAVFFINTVWAQNDFPNGVRDTIPIYRGSKYFPTKGSDALGNFKNRWYSEQLNALHEPILYLSKNNNNEIFRFTWIRSFDPAIVVRIEKQQDGKYMLCWKQGTGGAGYPIEKNYKVVVDECKSITKEKWIVFQRMLLKIHYRNLKTIEHLSGPPGTDGAEWILEEHSGKYYHVTDRWTPHAGSDYYKCCDYLLSLTDLKIPSDRKY